MKKLYLLMVVALVTLPLAAMEAPSNAVKGVSADEALADLPISAEGDRTVFRGRKQDRCLNHALWVLLRATPALKDATWPVPLVYPATPREGSDLKLQYFLELDSTVEPLLSDVRAQEQCKRFSLKHLEHELLRMIRLNEERPWPYCPEACRIRHFAMWEAIEKIRQEREDRADLERRSKKIDGDALPALKQLPSAPVVAHNAGQAKTMMPHGARVAMPESAKTAA